MTTSKNADGRTPSAGNEELLPLRFVIDCTSSMRYLGLPAVGIIRTEREVIRGMLAYSRECVFVWFDERSKKFRTIQRADVIDLIGTPSTKAEEMVARSRKLHLFKPTDVYINAGLPWDNDTIRMIYSLKSLYNFKVVQIVYDTIPVLHPELCVPGITGGFFGFLVDLSWTADSVYCISESTMNDYRSFNKRFNLREPQIHRIFLGADLARRTEKPPKITLPDRFEPVSASAIGPFVIYVSSISATEAVAKIRVPGELPNEVEIALSLSPFLHPKRTVRTVQIWVDGRDPVAFRLSGELVVTFPASVSEGNREIEVRFRASDPLDKPSEILGSLDTRSLSIFVSKVQVYAKRSPVPATPEAAQKVSVASSSNRVKSHIKKETKR